MKNYDMSFLFGNKCIECGGKLWVASKPRGKKQYECSACHRLQYPISKKDYDRELARLMYEHEQKEVRQDLLSIEKIAKLLGYNSTTVLYWVHEKNKKEYTITEEELIKYVNLCTPIKRQLRILTYLGYYHPTPDRKKLLESDKPLFEDEDGTEIKNLFE